ncbi:MAG TPA: hypothetical protein VGR07_00145 [Thermoanaerobaculia bacterium]|jgi:hypothetical protein|nr:hypothetical protein [Thermoanaerobaculia bacterium]
MKKMERIDDKLFRPLAATAAKLVFAGGTQTATTLVETSNPAPDFTRDGDNE